ncbi:hypothetical protein Tco_1071171 [Tanacetum coccineum]|uniref:Uncharacterized protein n=1 Tax=Tanacetum coccineum TaxID=301880 RepID=A0ABQ5HNS5_9ASTR
MLIKKTRKMLKRLKNSRLMMSKKGDDQAEDDQVGVPVSTTHKEKPDLLQSTSSHSISSNFGVPIIQQEPLHEVNVFVIPDPTRIPPSTPPTPISTTIPEVPISLVHESKALTEALQRLLALEKEVNKLKQVNQSEFIRELTRTQVPTAISTFLRSRLEKSL